MPGPAFNILVMKTKIIARSRSTYRTGSLMLLKFIDRPGFINTREMKRNENANPSYSLQHLHIWDCQQATTNISAFPSTKRLLTWRQFLSWLGNSVTHKWLGAQYCREKCRNSGPRCIPSPPLLERCVNVSNKHIDYKSTSSGDELDRMNRVEIKTKI